MTKPIHVIAETEEQLTNLYQRLSSPVNFQENSNTFEKIEIINDINVYYNDDLYVGANHLGMQFVDIITKLYPNKKFTNTLDWCCGAGFLGFAVFANKLTENLVLMDKYSPAIAACNKTINELNADNISAVQEIPNRLFDLVIGNPPWFLINNMLSLYNDNARKTSDVGGEVHKQFFKDIKSRLAPNGMIILVEGGVTSSPLYFKSMIEDNGLQITKVLAITDEPMYYMVIEHNES